MTLCQDLPIWKSGCAIVRAVKENNKMQVNIKTIPMKQIPEDMAQIRRKINTCEMELAQIRKELAELELSNVEEPLGRILQCEKSLHILRGTASCLGRQPHRYAASMKTRRPGLSITAKM